MLNIDLTKDLIPLSEFRANASPVLKRLRTSGGTVVVTHNGKAAAVMLSVEEYQRLLSKIEELTAIGNGLADVLQGQTIPHKEVIRRLKEHNEVGV